MKPELFLVHGWNMAPAAMLPFARALSTEFSVTLAVMPGYPAPDETDLHFGGVSIASSNSNCLQCAPGTGLNSLDTLLSALAKQAPPNAHWVGWSLGATLTLSAAIRSPETIRSMTLICPTPSFIARPQWPHGFERSTFEKLLRLTTKRYAVGTKQFLKLQLPNSSTEIFDNSLATLIKNQPTAAALQFGFGILCDTDLRTAIPLIQNPTMVIAAESDNVIPPAASRFVAEYLPAATIETVGDGHALPLSHAQQLVRLIVNSVNGTAI